MGIQDWRQNINDDEDLTPNGKLVAYTLANYYRPNKETFPSVNTLELSTGLSKGTVLRAIKELSEYGHLKVIQKVRKNRSSKSNHYEFIGATIEPMNEPLIEPSNELSIERSIKRSIIEPEIRVNKSNKNISKDIQKINYSVLFLNDEQLKDLKAIRKSKKGAETQRAINILAGEFKKARELGYTNEQIIDLICEKKWTGFKSEWIVNSGIQVKSKTIIQGMKPIIY